MNYLCVFFLRNAVCVVRSCKFVIGLQFVP